MKNNLTKLNEITETQLSTILKQSENIIEKKKLDKDRILDAFKYYASLKNEIIPIETLLAWIDEFENMDLTTEKVLIMIKETGLKKIYGKTCFNNFLNEDETYINHELINMEANRKCWYVLGKFGITNEGFNEQQRQNYDNTVLLEENNKLSQKLLSEHSNLSEIKRDAEIDLLHRLAKKTTDMFVLRFLKREIENYK